MQTVDIIEEFRTQYEEFKKSGHQEPSAMSVATVNAAGRPSSRIVLLKSYDERGFVFYTNYKSRKAADLEVCPFAALTFLWHETGRQVRVEGSVEKVSAEESDAYFASRNRKSQIGAWASKQSSEIENKLDFEKRIAKYSLKYAVGKVPRPSFWGGYKVIPNYIEFWFKKDFRLHERRVFSKQENGEWSLKRIYP